MDNLANKRQSTPGMLLRVGGASEIVSVLQSFDVDPDDVLNAAGIDPAIFGEPGNMITYVARDRLLRQCVTITGCQHFGLLVGHAMNLSSLGTLGLLAKTAPDVGSALRGIVSFLHIHSQAAILTLREEDSLVTFGYHASLPGLVAADQTGDGAVMMMLNVMQALCGPDFRPVGASFAHRRPDDIELFRKILRTGLFFNAEQYALMFSRNWLEVRPPGADPEMYSLLQKQMNATATSNVREFPDRVKQVLRTALLSGNASEEHIASIFSMGTHTLIRRLRTADASFRELTEACRADLAQELLLNTALSVSDIATTLGYSRASSFIRAFKGWCGATPGQWRAAHADR